MTGLSPRFRMVDSSWAVSWKDPSPNEQNVPAGRARPSVTRATRAASSQWSPRSVGRYTWCFQAIGYRSTRCSKCRSLPPPHRRNGKKRAILRHRRVCVRAAPGSGSGISTWAFGCGLVAATVSTSSDSRWISSAAVTPSYTISSTVTLDPRIYTWALTGMPPGNTMGLLSMKQGAVAIRQSEDSTVSLTGATDDLPFEDAYEKWMGFAQNRFARAQCGIGYLSFFYQRGESVGNPGPIDLRIDQQGWVAGLVEQTGDMCGRAFQAFAVACG